MFKIILVTSLAVSTLAIVGCSTTYHSTQQQKNLNLLQNKTWIMTQIGATEYKTNPNTHNAPSLYFGTDLQLNGADGCNRLVGNYAVKNHQISFGPLVSSEMLCMNSEELSTKYKQALNKVTAYQVYDQTLRLLDQYGNVLLKYETATLAQ